MVLMFPAAVPALPGPGTQAVAVGRGGAVCALRDQPWRSGLSASSFYSKSRQPLCDFIEQSSLRDLRTGSLAFFRPRDLLPVGRAPEVRHPLKRNRRDGVSVRREGHLHEMLTSSRQGQ